MCTIEKILIIGKGQQSDVVEETLIENNVYYEKTNFSLDDIEGFLNFYKEGNFTGCHIALTQIGLRDKISTILLDNQINNVNVISHHAIIASSAQIGYGNYIGNLTVIGPKTTIGNNNIIYTKSVIEHHSIFGNNNHLTGWVNIGGTTIIGDNNYFALGSSVLSCSKIGDNNFVTANSMVYKEILSNVKVSGKSEIIGDNDNFSVDRVAQNRNWGK